MNNKENVNDNKKYYRNLSLIFITFLTLFVIMNFLTKDKDFSETENRILSSKPKFSIDRLLEGRFTSKIEDYLEDQFIGRDFFTKIKIDVDKLVGKIESNGVFLGKGDYLIEKFNEPDEKLVNENLQAINNFTDKYKNVKHYILISPTATSILKDKLPIYTPIINQEKYLQSFKKELSTNIKFIDNYKNLYDHKNEYIFYKTDHHWTSLGAYYSYEKLCEDMELNKNNVDYYKNQIVSDDFFGALSSKSGYDVKNGDEINIYLPENEESEYVVVNYVEEQEKSATLYNSEALKEKDKYQVFLKGNHPLIKIRTNAQNTKTLLIFKDSYANSFIPFLIKDFSKIIVVDPRYYYEDLDKLMESENVNDVLYLYNANTFFEDTSLSPVLNNE